jgi:hypothetical protein
VSAIDSILQGDSESVQELRRQAPELWMYVKDFMLLQCCPNAFEFQAQPSKWRYAMRTMSEQWLLGTFMHLKYSPHDALAKAFKSD